MKAKRITKDEKVVLPLAAIDQNSGFGIDSPKEDGLLISLDPDEFQAVFLPDSELRRLGYVRK